MIFNHLTTEFWISYESAMNPLEILFLASFLQLVGRKVFLVSRLFYHIDVHEVFLSWWRTQGLKESPSYNWWIFDCPLFLYARNARTCSWVSQCSSMINTLCTAFWVPSRAIHIIRCSQHAESFVLILDKGLNDWFCRRYFWRACRSGWFSIFWINCRTLVLCACFTTECGSPGFRKSMSASFTIIDSWLSSWSAMDFSILLRSTSSSTLNVSLSWEERAREQSFASAVLRVATSRTVLSWVCSTLRLFLSSDNKSHRSFWRTEFFAKRINIDLLRTVRVSSSLHVIKSPRSFTNWIWSWLGFLKTNCIRSSLIKLQSFLYC